MFLAWVRGWNTSNDLEPLKHFLKETELYVEINPQIQLIWKAKHANKSLSLNVYLQNNLYIC